VSFSNGKGASGGPLRIARPTGTGAYSSAVVDALVQVPAWRDSGVPLRQALDRARKTATSQPTSAASAPTEYLVQTINKLGMHLVITRALRFTIEFANAKQQSVYPGRRLVGRSAPEVLTHSVGYIDTDAVLRHVASTGEIVRFPELRVPIREEGHWWTVTYSRLDPGSFEDVRVLITAVDDTRHVLARGRVQVLADEARHNAEGADERHRAFDVMASATALLREEPTAPLKRLLALVRHGLCLDAAAVFAARSGSLVCM
jgi:hypothetical protein